MNRLTALSFLFLLMYFANHRLYGQRHLTVLEYNVENLFDTLHAEGRMDEEFLPMAERRWTGHRYWKKLGQLNRVIAAVGGLTPPDLIALCEVENGKILEDLTQKTALRRWQYRYVITHSPDERGIDVALLYQPHTFRLLSKVSERIPYNIYNNESPTRDILHVSGEVLSGDTLDIFLCHFPSRAGDERKKEAYRCRAAALLKQKSDSVMALRQHPAVLIIGDFNDEFTDRSIFEILAARSPKNATSFASDSLYVLSAQKEADNGICGTYKYKGNWNQLDQVIVNGRLLLQESTLYTSWADCRIVDFPFLLQADKSHDGKRPRSTYRGTFYNGGFSDHLPMSLRLYLKE